MIATEPIPLMRVGGVAGNGLYGRQTLRGNLVYGGGPHEWINVPDMATPEHANTPLVRNLARRLAELFPGAAHVRVIRAWSGLVENTPDGLPVVERLSNPDNVVIATMSSVGFGLSPAVGRGISELVMHGRCSFADLSALSLSRFADTPPDWREQLGWTPARTSLTEVAPPRAVDAATTAAATATPTAAADAAQMPATKAAPMAAEAARTPVAAAGPTPMAEV